MQYRNILVRATNWVGDAVMSVPALQALRAHYPEARISILARPWVASLYGREPFCDELIPYNAPRGWRGMREKWATTALLWRKKFDCAILLQNAFEAAALASAARIPVRVGYSRDARAWLLTHPIPAPKPGETPRHQRFYYLELLKQAGLISSYDPDEPIRLSASEGARQQGRLRFREAGFTSPVIGVSPGAAYGGAKRWIPERFAEAAAQLATERSAGIAIFGSPEEAPIGEDVRSALGRSGMHCMNFAGKTSLQEFIDMAAACEIFLTNDSGPMHIASALGVPTVAIFGATDEIATGPTGPHSKVVRIAVECSPCLLRECPIDHRCMSGVSAARVVETARELVEIENWTREGKSSR